MLTARHKKAVLLLALVLSAQAAVFHNADRQEKIPLVKSLDQFPAQLGEWKLTRVGAVEPEVQAVLRADDLMTRDYASPHSRNSLSFFVAYFRSQRTGKAPHSPKNCLPGSGWVPTQSTIVKINVKGEDIDVNRYVVARGEYKSLVLYWYQSHNRVVASEYLAKIYLVLDSIRYNRSDVALARIVLPITDDRVDEAMQAGVSFIQAGYPELTTYLPPL
ncbi:MAG: EpsI family protein [Bryobacterales bacterium]|nr:EpsI family protein [Bryobacterales bacterium]